MCCHNKIRQPCCNKRTSRNRHYKSCPNRYAPAVPFVGASPNMIQNQPLYLAPSNNSSRSYLKSPSPMVVPPQQYQGQTYLPAPQSHPRQVQPYHQGQETGFTNERSWDASPTAMGSGKGENFSKRGPPPAYVAASPVSRGGVESKA